MALMGEGGSMGKFRQVRRAAVVWLALAACLWFGAVPADAAYGETLLKKGMSGDEVRQLQQQLFDLGYPLAVDGIFGPQTEAAVKQFQGDQGLTVDGIVGPKTFAALAAALERLASAPPAGANADTANEAGGGQEASGAATGGGRPGNVTARGGQRDAEVLDKLYQFAETVLGTPYRYGGTGLDGMDCSALTQLALQALGYEIPRSSVAQATVGIPVERHELKPGDLVFFNTSGSGISHVAVYLENNWLLNASVSKGVTYTSLLESYWDKRYHSARRIIGQ
ncbi:MAG: hypothetical protein A6D91_08085 [Bacillaceae bacterium G1]|nr:MAG: hypothetical protein A6D91_08085 [Bacillaceae bacterium G1]